MDGNNEKMVNNMENKMDENREQIENKMNEKMEDLKKSMYVIFLHNLGERIPKGDIKTQGNHENVEEINIESQNHDYVSSPNPHH